MVSTTSMRWVIEWGKDSPPAPVVIVSCSLVPGVAAEWPNEVEQWARGNLEVNHCAFAEN